MKAGDKRKVKSTLPGESVHGAKKGDEITFQDEVKHALGGMVYHFHTEKGKSIWLFEFQFRK